MKKVIAIFALIMVGLVAWMVMDEEKTVQLAPTKAVAMETKVSYVEANFSRMEIVNFCIYRDLDEAFTPLMEDGTLDMEIEFPEGYVAPSDEVCDRAKGK